MKRALTCLVAASCIFGTPVFAGWLDWLGGQKQICAPLDQECVTKLALESVSLMADEASVNAFGKVFGALWPHLEEAQREPVLDAYLARPEGGGVIKHMNIALARIAPQNPDPGLLRDLLDDPGLAGGVPLDYWADTLARAVLRADPQAAADLAIEKGDAFAEIARDALYLTLSWMARNDHGRLSVYLEAHDPPAQSYFNPTSHFFRVAADLCRANDDGAALLELVRADMLRKPITLSEAGALPMRAVLACEGLESALQRLSDMAPLVRADIARLRDLGEGAALALQRVIGIVNDDGLGPVIRALHAAGRTAEAETLAAELLPEAWMILSVAADQNVTITAEDLAPRLAQILEPEFNLSSHLDPVTALTWFVEAFDPSAVLNPTDYARTAVDKITFLWPAPLARTAYDKAMPLLAKSDFTMMDQVRLRLGVAHAQICSLPQEELSAVLDMITRETSASVRASALVEYLAYMKIPLSGATTCS